MRKQRKQSFRVSFSRMRMVSMYMTRAFTPCRKGFGYALNWSIIPVTLYGGSPRSHHYSALTKPSAAVFSVTIMSCPSVAQSIPQEQRVTCFFFFLSYSTTGVHKKKPVDLTFEVCQRHTLTFFTLTHLMQNHIF